MTPLPATWQLLVQNLALHACWVFGIGLWIFVWVIVWVCWALDSRIVCLWCRNWSVFLILSLMLLWFEWNSHLWEMDWEEYWSFTAIVWTQYLRFLACDNWGFHVLRSLVILVSTSTQTELVCILLWASFKVSQKLVVSLDSHDNLTMDVLYIHVLSAMPCMSSH